MLRLLEDLEEKLNELNIKKKDVCLLGSACLAINNFCTNNDLEFVINPKIWKALEQENYYGYSFNSFSNILKISDNLECQKNPLVMFDLLDNDMFDEENSFEYKGYRVIRPYIYVAHRILCNREKDKHIVEKYKNEIGWNPTIEKKIENLLLIAYDKGWNRPVHNLEKKWNELFEKNKDIYIFGAGSIGRHVYNRVKVKEKNNCFKGFLVTEYKIQNNFLDQRIMCIDEIKNKNCLVLIAVSIQHMVEIENLLKTKGFNNLFQAYQFYIKEEEKCR